MLKELSNTQLMDLGYVGISAELEYLHDAEQSLIAAMGLLRSEIKFGSLNDIRTATLELKAKIRTLKAQLGDVESEIEQMLGYIEEAENGRG